jgi:heterotetrameric sarcosine oxidase gamma subunit
VTELVWQEPLRGDAIVRPGFSLAAASELAVVRLQLFLRRGALQTQAEQALGYALPPPGVVVSLGAQRIAGAAPGTWLFIVGGGEDGLLAAALSDKLATLTAMVTPATHGQLVLRLTGSRYSEILARGTSVDVERLPPGTCAATRFAGVSVLLVPEPCGCLLIAGRSFAAYLRAWCDAASVDCC